MGAVAVKAVALAARRFPPFNGFFQNGQFKPSSDVHAGVATAIRGAGLASPAIHNSDQLTLDELMARMRDLIQRVRSGRIRSSEMADSTITVSSLGERGVEALYGMIYPPQVAIVGFGKVVVRPWVVEHQVVPRYSLPSRLRQITGRATATPVHCSLPKSASCCRSQTSYEQY